MEIHWRDTGTCPTEEEYLEMVKNSASSEFHSLGSTRQVLTSRLLLETGGLLRLAIKLMQISTDTTM